MNFTTLSIIFSLIALARADVQVGASKDATLYYSSYSCSPTQCGNTNYGSDATLGLGTYHISQSFLISFSFSVPAGTQVASATVGINLETAGAGWTSGSQVNIRRVTGDWSESAVTANSAPAFGDLVSTLTLDSLTPKYYTADLTQEVERAINAGESSINLVFQATGSVGYSTWSSKEGSNAPYLSIKTAPAASSSNPPASTQVQQSATCGCANCCGSQCYDPNAYVCQTNQNNGQPQLCPAGTQACGNACFFPNQYQCISSSNGYTLAPKKRTVM